MSGAGGTLILSGTDSYRGGTTVTAGTLIVTSDFGLPEGSSLTVAAGGTLIFDSTLVVAGPLAEASVSATTQAVPEPGTLALAIAGLFVGFVASRMRMIREIDSEG
jgi:autotransporter-associated beta strand protein